MFLGTIGGFWYTYLGRHVVSRPGGDGVSWASGGALWAPLAGLGRSPSRNRMWCLFILKIWHQVATISIIFLNWPNFGRLNSKDKSWQSQKYLGRQCLPLPLINSAYARHRGRQAEGFVVWTVNRDAGGSPPQSTVWSPMEGVEPP